MSIKKTAGMNADSNKKIEWIATCKESRYENGTINIETRRSSTLEKRVILVQGPC